MNNITRINLTEPSFYKKGDTITSIVNKNTIMVVTKIYNGSIIDKIIKFFNKDYIIKYYIEFLTINKV